ncbi:FAD/NAD(P)-binding domain-containing protein [Punctularia strigosozonata HHB-11173 SS5]|uniref:FAD/NAD(P)-binding domain-containing protein n=1 Tax=Punctularia strigosozonata (strain HHB-11173) TaxID=741275 RepID=UPI0004416FFB|nr:FAD/NAD(P)-binding domain-containing protein [Punctularia strigosozonata HHB-11173 SS5]EIN05354.1 FAD/NAD(P)-binding domain-containing protein [Punctularia strigosozonata HHB-11173 SS5]
MSGSESPSATPLHIIVVGGGLGGLAAAVALRRQGHKIEVFEATKVFNEIGAAIGTPPNAVKILNALGSSVERVQGVEYCGLSSFNFDGGAGYTVTLGNIAEKYGAKWNLCHRADMHDELARLAFGAEGDGPAAQLHLNSRVLTCDPSTGSITLASGETLTADLVIAADGIHSNLRTTVLGQTVTAPPSSVAAYRWITSASELKLDENPELSWVLKDGPSGPRVVTSAPGDFKCIFVYPCRGGKLVNALGIHIDRRDQNAVDLYVPATTAEMLDLYADFHPKFRKLLALAHDGDVGLWQLRSLPNLPTWINGRLCLLGDSAHAMLPTLGQGAAMALEDAVVLAALLPPGTRASDVASRLKLYEALRKDRAEFIKTESLEQITVPQKRGLYYRTPEMQTRVMGHDAAQEAREALEKEEKARIDSGSVA